MNCIEQLMYLSTIKGKRIYIHPNGMEEEIVWTMWDKNYVFCID